jgi:hypothetical protein
MPLGEGRKILGFFASLRSKLKEQTGNVYENKGGLWKACGLGPSGLEGVLP